MRSYEERMAEARKNAVNQEMDNEEDLAGAVAASETSSAYDVASETSSDIQQPSIDTQKLDRQIKSIMMVSFVVVSFERLLLLKWMQRSSLFVCSTS